MVDLQTRQGLLQQPRLSRWVESVNPTKSPIPSSCFRTRAGTLRGTRCLSMEVYALSNGRRKPGQFIDTQSAQPLKRSKTPCPNTILTGFSTTSIAETHNIGLTL